MGIIDKLFGKDISGDQPPEMKKLAAFIRTHVDDVRASASRAAQEATWLTNTAYLMGFDNIYFDTSTKQFKPVNVARKPLAVSRISTNKILPTIQTRLAKLAKNPPKYDVRPESTDQDDKDAARLGLSVINMLWEKLEVNLRRLELYMWVQQAGHGYLWVKWNPLSGNIMKLPDGGTDFEGDVDIEVVSPFEVFPDVIAKNEKECKKWVVAKVRRLDYFRDTYQEWGHLVKEEDAWLLSSQYESQINNMSEKNGAAGRQSAIKDSAIELTYLEKPSRKHPNGRMCVAANGVLLRDEELPVGMIDIVKFDDIIIAGKMYPESVITHLRPLQDRKNTILRKKDVWIKRLAAGKYSSPRGTGLSEESLNSESGEVLLYDHLPNAKDGGSPTPLPIPQIPAYLYKEEESIDREFNEVSAIGEASKAQLNSNIPAIGMQFLLEQEDTRVGIVTEGLELSWARVGKLFLRYVQKGYIVPRKKKTVGKGLEYAVESFQGAQLRGNDDVIVFRGSTLPGSKVMRRQEVLQSYSQGLLGDPADPRVREKVFGVLEYAELGELWQDYALDMNQIKKGVKSIESGFAPSFSEFDNHDMWCLELNRYRKQDAWDSLDPTVQQLVMDTIEIHIQALVRLMNPGIAAEEKVKEETQTVQSELEQDPSLMDGADFAEEPASLMPSATA